MAGLRRRPRLAGGGRRAQLHLLAVVERAAMKQHLPKPAFRSPGTYSEVKSLAHGVTLLSSFRNHHTVAITGS